MVTLLAFVFVLFILVFVHELGHFLAARSVGVRVERFYVGFNLFGLGIKRKIGDTEYGLGLIPLGGYVKMAGMIDESMDQKLTGAEWEFQSKTPLQRIWIMSAGVIANLMLAVLVFATVTLFSGINESDPQPVIGSLVADYPAAEVGLQPGDIITSVDGQRIETWVDMTTLIHQRPDSPIHVTWLRDGDTHEITLTTKATETLVDDEIRTVGMIGIGPRVTNRPAGFGEAVATGLSLTRRWFVLTYKSLGMIVTGKASLKEVGGPIMIAQLAGQSAQSGAAALWGLLAVISVNLAFINILPIPALDGGHVVLTLMEMVRRQPLSMRTRMVVQQLGMMLLLSLIAVIMYNDVVRLFQ